MKHGSSVTLIPRIKRPDGKGFLPGPDAIVNGLFFEFKTVTGRMDKIGARFRESRTQGGYKGNIILTFGDGLEEKTYFFRIKDFKK